MCRIFRDTQHTKFYTMKKTQKISGIPPFALVKKNFELQDSEKLWLRLVFTRNFSEKKLIYQFSFELWSCGPKILTWSPHRQLLKDQKQKFLSCHPSIFQAQLSLLGCLFVIYSFDKNFGICKLGLSHKFFRVSLLEDFLVYITQQRWGGTSQHILICKSRSEINSKHQRSSEIFEIIIQDMNVILQLVWF